MNFGFRTVLAASADAVASRLRRPEVRIALGNAARKRVAMSIGVAKPIDRSSSNRDSARPMTAPVRASTTGPPL